MNKEFVKYEQALALKELGFDEPCFGSYVKLTETQNTFFMNDVVSEIDRETPLHKSLITKAPLYQQAFRWMREKHGVYSSIFFEDDTKYYYQFNDIDGIVTLNTGHKTYEEAEQACLNKLIEIVKNR